MLQHLALALTMLLRLDKTNAVICHASSVLKDTPLYAPWQNVSWDVSRRKFPSKHVMIRQSRRQHAVTEIHKAMGILQAVERKGDGPARAQQFDADDMVVKQKLPLCLI